MDMKKWKNSVNKLNWYENEVFLDIINRNYMHIVYISFLHYFYPFSRNFSYFTRRKLNGYVFKSYDYSRKCKFGKEMTAF